MNKLTKYEIYSAVDYVLMIAVAVIIGAGFYVDNKRSVKCDSVHGTYIYNKCLLNVVEAK